MQVHIRTSPEPHSSVSVHSESERTLSHLKHVRDSVWQEWKKFKSKMEIINYASCKPYDANFRMGYQLNDCCLCLYDSQHAFKRLQEMPTTKSEHPTDSGKEKGKKKIVCIPSSGTSASN